MATTLHTKLRLKPQWNTRAFSYDPILLYATATLITGIVVFTKLLLTQLTGVDYPFVGFFAAIVASAWIGGLRAGLYSTILSAISMYFLFSEPALTFAVKSPSAAISASVFMLEGTFVSFLSHTMHRALKGLEIKNEELVQSEERYRLVVETVKDYSIYTMDKDGYITSWNEGAHQIKGYTQDDVMGRHYSMFFEDEEIEDGKPWKYLISAIENGRFEDEGWRKKKDGTKIWANIIITPIKDAAGTIYGFSAIVKDLTERREIERRKDEFISIASHELKTPVTSMKVFTQILLKTFNNFPQSPPVKYLMKMDVQLNKLTSLINDLLDVTKIQTGKLEFKNEQFNIAQLVTDIVENMQEISPNHKIMLKGHIQDMINGDKDRIGQVLINCITNAVKYSPNADLIEVGLAQDRTQALLYVKDYGVGIPQEYTEKVFERFFRVYDDREKTYPGLGMGLYISSEIVKRHSGKMWVESEIGKGSTFYISLPITYI